MGDGAGGGLEGFGAPGGETAGLIRDFDWGATSLGPMEAWPQSLKTTVQIMLGSPVAMVLLWGAEGVLIYNDAYARFADRKHPEILGIPVREAWPEIADFNADIYARVLGGETLSLRDQMLVLSRSGAPEAIYLDLDYSPVADESGRPAGELVIVVETTARRADRMKLADERARLEAMFEAAPSFIGLLEGPEHRFVLANAAYRRLVGGRELVGLTVAEALPEVVEQGFIGLLDQVLTTGQAVIMSAAPVELATGPGGSTETHWLDFVYQPLKDADGAITGVFVEGYDVTGLYATTEALKASEARKSVLVELNTRIAGLNDPEEISFTAAEILARHMGVDRAGYGLIDRERETISIARDWNAPGVRSLAGVLQFRDYGSYIEQLKQGVTVVIADAREDERTRETAGALEGINARSFVNMPVTEEGSFVALLYLNHGERRDWTEAELSLIREVASVTRSAVERRRAEEALRASEAQFRAFAQAVPNHVWASRPDGHLYWFNEQVYAYVGLEPGALEGLEGWGALVHPDDLPGAVEAWTRSLSTGETYHTEFRIRRHDGAWRWFTVRAEPVRDGDGAVTQWVGANIDIDDLKALNATLESRVRDAVAHRMQAEQALHQSQKMETVGQLTGGVAHDFNNLLTPIVGALDMLQRRPGNDERASRLIEGALTAADRAKTLVHRLLAFSRRQHLEPRAVDVGAVLETLRDLIARSLGPGIALRFRVQPGLPAAHVDPNQLELALLNLAVNARDAMGEEGVLSVTAEAVDCGPHGCVRISVADTGAGMDAETLARAVEPFFTTKEVGRGTGLGLSSVKGLAEQSGGEFSLESEVGRGTTAILTLPAAAGPAEPDRAEPEMGAVAGGRAVILLVDDEAGVRLGAADMLTEAGYTVVEASGPTEAIRDVEGGLAFDLLITDYAMPGMSGARLAAALKEKRPDLPVLLTTGYASMREGDVEGLPRLAKPFRQTELVAAVRAVLRR